MIDYQGLIKNVPDELRKLPNWVGCKIVPSKDRPGKTDKIPMNALTGECAKSNDPSTWTDFDTALDLSIQRNYDAIGFMFQPPYVGVDLDHCVKSGVIAPHALEILKQLGSYAELSPSGTGIHVICKGEISRALKQSKIEIYTSGRFFTVTGNRLEEYPAVIEDRTKVLNNLIEENSSSKLKTKKSSKKNHRNAEEILKAIAQSKDADKFNQLFNGEWEGHYGSQSEADLALCGKLAFWTSRDSALMDSIFRQSKLLREKWDTVHHSDGRTYGQGTIEATIELCEQVYLPASKDHQPSNNNDVATQILTEHILLHYADKFYEYREGCYRPLYVEEVHRWIKVILRKKFSVSKVNNILLSLKTEVFKKPDDIKCIPFLNLKNGLFDIDTYELKPHSPTVFSINQLNVKYDEITQCALWLKSLSEIFEGDADRIALLQEYFGYCLTRETDYEKALFLNGEGANGKTVILYVLEQLLGKENISSVPLEKFNDFHYLARLSGSLANISIETNAKSEVYDNTFKAIVTGDTISADGKYGQPFEFKPFCKLIFSTNNLPRVDDKTEGFYRRLLIIRFDRQFSKEERDPKLKYKIVRNELDGVFVWALEGLRRLRQRGYFDDSLGMEEISNYRKENNNVMIFVEETCEVEKIGTVSIEDLYKRYAQWCKDNGYRGLSKIKFGKELVRAIPDVKRGRFSKSRYWEGIEVPEKDDPRPF